MVRNEGPTTKQQPPPVGLKARQPRIFQQLGLETSKVVCNHDTNAQTEHAIQWDRFRLPSKSFALTFASVCGVTHYVWIPANIASVTIVGPADAIANLIDLSNEAVPTRLTEAQLILCAKHSVSATLGLLRTKLCHDMIC